MPNPSSIPGLGTVIGGAKNVGRDGNGRSGLTVKGAPMTTRQQQVATILLGVAQTLGAGQIAAEACIFDAIYESSIGEDNGWDSSNATYGGPLGGSVSNFGSFGGAASDAVAQAMATFFFKGGKGFQGGGAIALARSHSDIAYIGSQVTAATPFDSNGYSTQYEAQGFPFASAIAEAKAIVAGAGGLAIKGGVAGVGGTGTVPNGSTGSTYKFQIGSTSNPGEDVWTGTNRLAQEVNWYCLSLDTPIPTPDGWMTMGELREGDRVFGTDGQPTRVAKLTPVFDDHECYRLTFGDGMSVVADANHPWETTSLYRDTPEFERVAGPNGRTLRYRAIRSTGQIASSVQRRGDRKTYNHHIRLAAPLVCPPAALPIDPYIFGYWLGDGSKTGPAITIGAHDRAAFVAEVERTDLEIANEFKHGDSPCSNVCLSTGKHGGFRRALRTLGVYGDKHIPPVYARASVDQRIALLQGLMDSDGCMGGRCMFANVNRRLAEDVHELVRGLGIKAYWSEKKGGREITMPRGHVSIAKDCFSVLFAPVEHLDAFRLARKRDKYRVYLERRQIAGHSRHHTIVSAERVESEPVCCIEVEAEDHMFLVGEAMVPTHNCFTNGEALYYMDGQEMIAQKPALYLDRVQDAGRFSSPLSIVYDNTAYQSVSDHKHRFNIQRKTALVKMTSPTQVTFDLICGIDEIRAGDVIVLTSFGPGEGRWIVSDCQRSVFNVFSTITLVPPVTPLTETSVAGATGKSSTTNAAGMTAAAGTPTGSFQGLVSPFAKKYTASLANVDMGVDFSASQGVSIGDPFLAIGDCYLRATVDFSDGSYQPGMFFQFAPGVRAPHWGWYVAEQLNPKPVGSKLIKAGTIVATYAASGTGIEIGWAAGPGQTQASVDDPACAASSSCRHAYGGMAAGREFLSFLKSAGAIH